MPNFLIIILILIPMLLIVLLLFWREVQINNKKKIIEKMKNNNLTSDLIKFKTELSSIDHLEIEGPEIEEISSIWYDISKTSQKIKRDIEECEIFLKQKKIFKLKNKLINIEKNIANRERQKNDFNTLSISILGDKKNIQEKLSILKKGLRELKEFHNSNLSFFSKRTKEKTSFLMKNISNIIENIEENKQTNNDEKNKEKNDFIELSSCYENLIMLFNCIISIENFIHKESVLLIKQFELFFNFTNKSLGNSLNVEEFENNRESLMASKREIIEIYYVEDVFDKEKIEKKIKNFYKRLLEMKNHIELEKKSYKFIESNYKYLKIMGKKIQTEKINLYKKQNEAYKIDSDFLSIIDSGNESIENKMKESQQIIENFERENESKPTSFAKQFFLLKNYISTLNKLNNEIIEEYNNIAIFYYEDQSIKLKIELLNKLFIQMNYKIESSGIDYNLNLFNKIFFLFDKLKELLITKKEKEIRDVCESLYSEIIIYIKDSSLNFFRKLLIEELIYEVGYLRVKNINFNKEIISIEGDFKTKKYDVILNSLLHKIDNYIH